jgi:hypothetical protein
MVDIAVNHLSSAQVEDIAGKGSIFYRQFILPKQTANGRNKTKVLRFDKELLGREMTDEEKNKYGLRLYMESGKDKAIMAVNPELAARMKYLIHIDPEEMFVENKEYRQQLLTNMYSLLREDPLINPEILVRKLAYAIFRSEGDELLAKPQEMQQMAVAEQTGDMGKMLSGQNKEMAQFMKESGVEGRAKQLSIVNP